MRLLGDEWVMVVLGDAHELHQTNLSEFYACAFGGHIGRFIW